MSDDRGDEYVGYKHPPATHRFKKGDPSPHPSGRPRKKNDPQASSRKIREISVGEAKRIVKLSENGRSIELTVYAAILRAMGLKAMKGDPRAAKFIVDHFDKYLSAEEHALMTKRDYIIDDKSDDPHAAAKAYQELIAQPLP